MEHDDIDELIAELHASTNAPQAPAVGDTARLERWLALLSDLGGSDLLLVAGAPPSVRVDGRVRPLAEGPLDGVDVEEAVLPALPPPAADVFASICTGNVAAPRPPSAPFRFASRGSPLWGCRPTSSF